MRKTRSLLILLPLAFGIILASAISAASVVVFAQENQTTTNVTPAGKQTTKIINQTSTPANLTTTTIQKKSEPVGTVPLPSNQTKLSPSGSQAPLPPVSNKTTTTPTGNATTTIINQTSTPINVTSTNASTALNNYKHHHQQLIKQQLNNNHLIVAQQIRYPIFQ